MTHASSYRLPEPFEVVRDVRFDPLDGPARDVNDAADEATNNQQGPGRFRQLEEMKVTQETVLELAKCRRVLAGAIRDENAPENQDQPHDPTSREVAAPGIGRMVR